MLYGHREKIKMLKNIYAKGCAFGTYLFSGSDGIGKKMVALWFAKLLNCPSPNAPCGVCLSCRKIERGEHPDVRVISRDEKKTAILIDDVRQEIIEESSYQPFEGKYRVFIIDNAHDLNEQSQNALLKTLEEPPPFMVIILVTSRPSELLPTVLSRCREIRFLPLKPEEVMKIMDERMDIPKEKIPLLTALSSGSPGKGLFLAYNETFWQDRESLLEILCNLEDKDIEELIQFANGMDITFADRVRLENFFEVLISWIRDILLLKNSIDNLFNIDYSFSLKKVYSYYNTIELLQMKDLILETRELVFKNNLNIKMAILRILIQIKKAYLFY